MLTTDLQEKLKTLAPKACAHYASDRNAANANEFSALTMAEHISHPNVNGETGIMFVMRRGKVNLSELFALDEDDRQHAFAIWSGACYDWLDKNPD